MEPGIGDWVFHDFLLMILAGRNAATGKPRLESPLLCKAANGEEFQPDLNLPDGRISRRDTVAVGKDFLASRKGIWSQRTRALE